MPQHARRLKIRRKDLRKPDEFETLTGQALAWAGEHPAVVYGVLAVAIVVLVGSLAVGRWRAARNEAAAVAFRSAQGRFNATRTRPSAAWPPSTAPTRSPGRAIRPPPPPPTANTSPARPTSTTSARRRW